jgi:molecular chaperone DnaK (HSP70)
MFGMTCLLGPDVQETLPHLRFKLRASVRRIVIGTTYQTKQKTYTPEDVVAMILRYLKARAEIYLGQTISHVIVAVPRCSSRLLDSHTTSKINVMTDYNDVQRQALRDAGPSLASPSSES